MLLQTARPALILGTILAVSVCAFAKEHTDKSQGTTPAAAERKGGTPDDTQTVKAGAASKEDAQKSGGTIKGNVYAKPSKYRKNVAVYIDKIPGKEFPPPEKHAVIDQVSLTFVPHVLPVLTGTTVDFVNSDNVLHNVFTPDKCADKFNLGSYPKEVVKSRLFDKPGCRAVMLCNVHPEMEAWVVTVETPYYAVTDEEGNFTIENVPPGTYTLKTWHKRKKPAEQEVTVKAGETTEVTFKLKR